MLRTERGEGAREMQILSYKKLQSNYKSVKKFQKQQNWNTYVLAICGLTSVRLAVTAATSWIHVPPSQATNPETNENRTIHSPKQQQQQQQGNKLGIFCSIHFPRTACREGNRDSRIRVTNWKMRNRMGKRRRFELRKIQGNPRKSEEWSETVCGVLSRFRRHMK